MQRAKVGLVEYFGWHGEIDRVETKKCVHCGRHFHARPGSGKIRGYCARCNGVFCSPTCTACVPEEQQLDNREAGRPLLFRPTRVSVPDLPAQ